MLSVVLQQQRAEINCSKVWGRLEIFLFLKDKHYFLYEANVKLIRKTI